MNIEQIKMTMRHLVYDDNGEWNATEIKTNIIFQEINEISREIDENASQEKNWKNVLCACALDSYPKKWKNQMDWEKK